MIDQLGHVLVAWLLPVNVWTCVLFAAAALVDRTLGHRTRASLRVMLYAPIALRVLWPLSWSIPTIHLPSAVTVLPLDALAAGSAVTSHDASWYAAATVVYVAIAAALGTRFVMRRRNLARSLASARSSAVGDAPCPVLVHANLGPMVAGVIAPTIVIPEAMLDGADPRALACVLKHEIAHVRRGDPWLASAIEIMLVVAWPIAPLWLAAARVRHLMEVACDEAALDGADVTERRRYGHVLLDVAEQQTSGSLAAGSLQFGATLRARIEAIAKPRPWPRAVQATLVVAAVASFVACSAAGPDAAPRPTTSARAASSTASVDQYGYQFEDDAMKNGGDPTPAAPTKNAQGRLAPEAIQTVVRGSFGTFRQCYERALTTSSKLEGIVSVSFVIQPDGSVHDAADKGSTMPDANVVQCVVGGFSHLAFPPPQGGYVTVVYPIAFHPGD